MPGHRPRRAIELPRSYAWYDRQTGAIDLLRLATDSMMDVEPKPELTEPPPWIACLGLPRALPGALAVDLAKISGRACRAWIEAGRPGYRFAPAASSS